MDGKRAVIYLIAFTVLMVIAITIGTKIFFRYLESNSLEQISEIVSKTSILKL